MRLIRYFFTIFTSLLLLVKDSIRFFFNNINVISKRPNKVLAKNTMHLMVFFL